MPMQLLQKTERNMILYSLINYILRMGSQKLIINIPVNSVLKNCCAKIGLNRSFLFDFNKKENKKKRLENSNLLNQKKIKKQS
jgi:hypothetical protein